MKKRMMIALSLVGAILFSLSLIAGNTTSQFEPGKSLISGFAKLNTWTPVADDQLESLATWSPVVPPKIPKLATWSPVVPPKIPKLATRIV